MNKELQSIKAMYKEFAKIERRGFKEIKKIAAQINDKREKIGKPHTTIIQNPQEYIKATNA